MGQSKSYAETINDGKVMISGLKSNTERVAKRGLSADFITNLENVQKIVMDLDNEQKDLKAKLKSKPAELEKNKVIYSSLMSEARKVVKLEMEKESWKSFGINDKK